MTNTPIYSFCMALTAILILSISPNAVAQQSTAYLDDASHQFWHDDSTLSAITIGFSQSQWDLLLQSSASVRNEVSAMALTSLRTLALDCNNRSH